MATVADFIASTLRLIGTLGHGEVPNIEESSDALAALNNLIDSWNSEGLTIYTSRHDLLPLVSGQQTYLIGTDADDWDTDRPVKITSAGITTFDGHRVPLQVLNTEAEWASILEKTVQGRVPERLWYDNAYPIGSVSLWPIPIGHKTAITAPATALTATLAGTGAGNVDLGAHSYKVTYINEFGETEAGSASATVTVADYADNKIALTDIPVSLDATVTARKIYRSKATDSAKWYLLTTLNDNTTRTYIDNIADADLGVVSPHVNNTDGTSRLDLYTRQQLSQYAALTDTFALPPAYYKALRYNLGIDLSVEYGRPIDQVMVGIALQSKQALMNLDAERLGIIKQDAAPVVPVGRQPAQPNTTNTRAEG